MVLVDLQDNVALSDTLLIPDKVQAIRDRIGTTQKLLRIGTVLQSKLDGVDDGDEVLVDPNNGQWWNHYESDVPEGSQVRLYGVYEDKESVLFKRKEGSWRPVSDYIFIKPDERPKETESGLILPDSNKTMTTGTVISVGPGRFDEKYEVVRPEVRAGERVVFSKYGATQVLADGIDGILIPSSGIYAVIE